MRATIFFGAVLSLLITSTAISQQAIYDVTAGNGYGIRFWSADAYKIHMGNGTEYNYGPVTSYSVKMNMNNESGRGWTWGNSGVVPIAALNNLGDMQIAGTFVANKIGLGTSLPSGRLHIKDGPYWSSYNYGATLVIDGPHHNAIALLDAGSSNPLAIANVSGNLNFAKMPVLGDVSNPPISLLIINNNGNVGIGTSTPNQKLTVNGTIYGKEVKVDLNVPGPDYVFEENYNLPSLAEIENYIKQNKHLPGVPSAKEMEMNGINLSEMNMLLLKKMEELTLHLIEQNNRMEELIQQQIVSNKKIENQQGQIEVLKKSNR